MLLKTPHPHIFETWGYVLAKVTYDVIAEMNWCIQYIEKTKRKSRV